MPEIGQNKRHSRKVPIELLAVDIGATGTKIVRLKKAKEGFTVLGADVLPTIPLYGNGSRDPSLVTSLQMLPKTMKANYAALAISSQKAVVRLLSLPGQLSASDAVEANLREHAGLEGQYRLSYQASSVRRQQGGKAETKFLAVAIPEAEATSVLELVPDGPPAPCSLELSGLGAINAFLYGPGDQVKGESVAVIEAGAASTYLALFNRGDLVLVRKFDFGCHTLVKKVQEQMGVDQEVAEGIISDGSFDISGCIRDVMGPFLRQLSISRDFVERQEKCRITKLFLSGGMSLSSYWVQEITRGSKMDVFLWNPFASFSMAHGAYPESMKGQETRFSAALGAGLGALAS